MRIFFLVLPIFLVSLNLWSQNKLSNNPSIVSSILKKKELTIGVMRDDRWPHFYKNSKGENLGIDLEVAEKFAQELGVKLKVNRNFAGFKTTLEAVAKKEVDIAFSAFYPTIERAALVRFSEPYCLLRGMTTSRRAGRKPAIKNASIVGTFSGTFFEATLREKFPEKKIVTYDSRKNLWKDLQTDLIDEVYTDELELEKARSEIKDFDFYYKVVPDDKSAFPVSAAFNLEHDELVDLFNQWVSNHAHMGNLKKICQIKNKR